MSIRKPLTTVLDYNDSGNVGATSIVSKTFNIPQDCDGVVMKVQVASIVGTAGVVDIYLQTTDDGGTTWYDCANIRPTYTVVASTINIVKQTAMFAAVPVDTIGSRANGSVITAAAASTIGANQYSGLPLLDTFGRVSIVYTGTIATNNGLQVQVKANSQANRA